jgi:3-hydroxyisobutyrate dehydrogenase-like beta-hydroxyacid dehydrogenase
MPAIKLDTDAERIGFLGLGLMGSRITRRLHAAGWNVRAWNRSAEPAREISRAGSVIAKSAAQLAAESIVILSCLANDAAVEAVYLGREAILSSLNPGTIVLEMSTISPGMSQKLHTAAEERGISLLDLAIAGSTPEVEAGTVTLFAGGDRSTFEECTPIYESIARQCFDIGPAGSGILMKLVVNLLLGVSMEAIAEAISLGEHLHIDKNVLLSVLSKTAVIPPAHAGKFKKLRAGDYSPQFPLKHMSKDLNLVMAAAANSHAKLPLASAAQQVFAANVASSGDLDLSAITPYIVDLDDDQAAAASNSVGNYERENGISTDKKRGGRAA